MSGSVVGGYNIEFGQLDWEKSGNSLSGSGSFQNIYDQTSQPVQGTLDATCAE